MIHRFHKMHGLGNDFVIFDAREQAIEIDEGKARAICDRETGIGCDQLILIEPSDVANIHMRIFNRDGGEVEACGNAARCVTLLVGTDISIETAGGTISGSAADGEAAIDLPEPRFEWDEIPLAYAMDTAAMPVGWDELQNPMAVNVGNPHLVFFVEDSQVVDVASLGPQIETDPLFPERINVNVASIEGDAIRLRTWERGAGLTRACGTGACATAVAAIRRKLVKSPVEVYLPGGSLVVEWKVGDKIRMRGPGTFVFTGQIDLDLLS